MRKLKGFLKAKKVVNVMKTDCSVGEGFIKYSSDWGLIPKTYEQVKELTTKYKSFSGDMADELIDSSQSRNANGQ